MKVRLILLAAASAVAFAGSADAATGYSGFHVEAQGGWDRTTAKLKYDDSVFQETDKASRNGVTYGFATGYDVDFGGFLLGAEGGINWSSTKYCASDDVEKICLKSGRDLELGVRGGTQLGANGPLVYAKIAYVNGQAKLTYDDIDGDALRAHRNMDGVRFGVGLEQKVSRQFYVKAEYRYTTFKDFRLDEAEKLGFSRNQVIGGVGVLF